MDYKEINRQSWNKRVEPHMKSAFYDNTAFLQGNTSLKEIELALLPNLTGKSVLHLQCHFGQDSISMSRMGASVTGVDLSDKAIYEAQKLAKEANCDTQFICSDVYDLPNHLDQQFDFVFTSYGVIGWLPDMDKWADIIHRFLKPGGQLIFVEFHPVVWMFDDDFTKVAYRYFKSDPIIETQEGTYADKDAEVKLDYVVWNHGMAEVLQALLTKGIEIQGIQEYDYSPYDCVAHLEEFSQGKYRIKHFGNKIPMVYSIVGRKS
jgi:2-polyprenyl-3-methyl-5-hydroxy-6-metoxy-1,4-benzoquinol methylase